MTLPSVLFQQGGEIVEFCEMCIFKSLWMSAAVSLPQCLSLLLRVTGRCVLVQEKEKRMQTTPPLRVGQGILGNEFKVGTQ